MSVVNYTIASLVPQQLGNNAVVYTWTPLHNGDSGQPISGPGFVDRSFQFEGTPGGGFSAVIEGSNDAVNYHTLTDPFGNVLTLTTVGLIKQVTEITLWIRPHVTGGDGTTSITVTAVACNHSPN